MKRELRVRPWPRVSTFLMDNLSGAILGDAELEADPPGVLKRACASCDAAVVAEHPGIQHPLGNPGPGSTAIVVLLLPPRMFVANVGDSRAIAAAAEGEIVFQSVDQRPSRPEERARILRLGGMVRNVDGGASTRTESPFHRNRQPFVPKTTFLMDNTSCFFRAPFVRVCSTGVLRGLIPTARARTAIIMNHTCTTKLEDLRVVWCPGRRRFARRRHPRRVARVRQRGNQALHQGGAGGDGVGPRAGGHVHPVLRRPHGRAGRR